MTEEQAGKLGTEIGIEDDADIQDLKEDDLIGIGLKPVPARRILRKLGVSPATPSPAAQTISVSIADHAHMTMPLRKLVDELTGSKESEVIAAARSRLRGRCLVRNEDGTLNPDKTMAYLDELNQGMRLGDVYDGLIVATLDEFLDLVGEADPVTGDKLRNGKNPRSNVQWGPVESRIFAAWLVIKGYEEALDQRGQRELAKDTRNLDSIPDHLGDYLILFRREQGSKTREFKVAEDRVIWRPEVASSSSPFAGNDAAELANSIGNIGHLSGQQSGQLQKALLSAFPSNGVLREMVSVALDQRLDEIAGGGNLSDIVFNLIVWAQARGKVSDLLMGAVKQNPGNPKLRDFATSFQK